MMHKTHFCCRLLTRMFLFLGAAFVGMFATSALQAQRSGEPRGDGTFRKSNSKVLAAFREVVARPSQSAVRVLADGKIAALGTIVEAEGLILTKASELKGKISCKLKDGRELEATIVGVHQPYDLALLRIEAQGLTPVQWQESKGTAVGNWVASAGISDDPVAVGVVSVGTRNVSARGFPSASPRSGSGYLGIMLDPDAVGAMIERVTPGSAAEKAGLKANDRILSVGGKAVEDGEALIALLGGHKPREVVTVRVLRDEKELDLTATLDKRPATANRGELQNRLGSDLSERRGGFPSILQHDTVLKPSDCGGPLVGLDGKALGINIARAGRTESYAVPSEAIFPLLNDLKSGKLAPSAQKESKTSSKPADEKK